MASLYKGGVDIFLSVKLKEFRSTGVKPFLKILYRHFLVSYYFYLFSAVISSGSVTLAIHFGVLPLRVSLGNLKRFLVLVVSKESCNMVEMQSQFHLSYCIVVLF